jgi:beta-mannosidase
MKRINLDGEWKFRKENDSSWLPATVPGCVHTDLMAAKQIPDPYYRDNENDVMWIGETAWMYARTFEVPEEFLQQSKVILHCESLDTLSTIYINGQKIGKTNNQFRVWEFEVRKALRAGENEIQIYFESALLYGQARLKERYIHSWGTDTHKLPGGNYVRKSQCNFGWDWGPKLVTCGILGHIELQGFDLARLDDVYIKQNHSKKKVELVVGVIAETLTSKPLNAHISVTYEGEGIASEDIPLTDGIGRVTIAIEHPLLWWPNGLGEQPLYQVEVQLLEGEMSLDSVTKKIGLRTLSLVRKEDQWGESFYFECNGVPFFAKGSNWIPADTFVTRVAEEEYVRLLQAAKDSHQNMVRVWGGGIYESDIFYDVCDRMGITVWQDFMFSCATYPTFDEAFMSNVEEEARQQIKRIRHHPSLALLCGNNEIEQGLVGDNWTEITMSWEDYEKLFDEMLPQLVVELSPQTDYWPGSPHSPKGNRLDWKNPQWGDTHIWDVWHGLSPFEAYRFCTHRFISEFGFQSFPEPRSIDAFAIPSDLSINSPVMEHHQRSRNGNAYIIHYMLDWFRLPTKFEHQIILSQILQGVAIKYGVEHWRRSMPRTMGSIYWQLNDCWPVASWSSIDYYGRWKALHYMARRFFAPLSISGIENSDTGQVDIYLVNDEPSEGEGVVRWKLMTVDKGKVILDGQLPVKIPGLSSSRVETLELAEQLKTYGKNILFVFMQLEVGGESVSENLVFFCRPKQLNLQNPKLRVDVGKQRLKITAKKPALWVWVDLDVDAPFSDNFFHVIPGQERVIELPHSLDAKELTGKIPIFSLWDTYQN